MRQAARRGILTVMATGSVLASTAGYAYADAGAVGTAADSPGVGSGNAVQVPVDVPVNVCGNTIDVVGLLNPAMGNNCENASGHGGSSHQNPSHHGSSHHAGPGAGTAGGTHHSPGVGSGNTVQVPVTAPVNACGDSANVVGVGNPAFGNHCASHSGTPVVTPPGTPPQHCSCPPPPPPPKDTCPPPGHGHPQPPPPKPPVTPPTTPPGGHHSPPPPPQTVPTVPHQGTTTVGSHSAPPQAVLASTGADAGTMLMAPAGAAMALGGMLLYRRSRAAQR